MTSDSDHAFVEGHRGLVRSIAQTLRGQLDLRCELDDLMAFGFQGLLEARRRYDPARGVQFNTFAYYRVRGAVVDGIRKMAYLPRRAHARLRAAEAADFALEEAAASRAATPTPPGGLAAAEALDGALGRLTATYVMAAVGQGEDDAPETPEQGLERAELSARVRAALERLGDRERALVVGFYFEGRRFDDVAATLGISKSWASRLHTKALGELRDALADPAGAATARSSTR